MPVPASNPQDTQAALAFLIALAACFCVLRWRVTLKVALVILIALAIYGALIGFQGLTSVLAHLQGHHQVAPTHR